MSDNKPVYPGTRLRNLRVDDALWDAAIAKAEAEGRSLSEVIREYLKRWVAQPAREKKH